MKRTFLRMNRSKWRSMSNGCFVRTCSMIGRWWWKTTTRERSEKTTNDSRVRHWTCGWTRFDRGHLTNWLNDWFSSIWLFATQPIGGHEELDETSVHLIGKSRTITGSRTVRSKKTKFIWFLIMENEDLGRCWVGRCRRASWARRVSSFFRTEVWVVRGNRAVIFRTKTKQKVNIKVYWCGSLHAH